MITFSFRKALHAGKPVLLMVALLCSFGVMSAPPGPDGNRGHLNRLLHDPAVVQHLGLSVEEAKTAQSLSNGVVEVHRADFERALAPATKAERVPLVARVFVSVNRETFKALEDVLSDAQLERLKQIEIQTFGIRALVRPATVKQLDLDPSQVDMLRDIGNEAGGKLSSLHQSPDLERSEKSTRARAIQQSAMNDARQFLTEEQWVKWELLVGAGFTR